MVKPNLVGMPLIPPLHHHGYEHYLPTAFDESMTLLQKVNKCIYTLNELGQLTNDMLERWNSVYQWVLNEGLEEAVKDKLEEWLKDGTLADLIDLVLLGSIKERLEELEKTVLDLVKELEELKKNGIGGGLSSDNYYKGLVVKQGFCNLGGKAGWTSVKIPHTDEDGELIPLKIGFPEDKFDSGKLETARNFANRHDATFVSNASTFSTTRGSVIGKVILDGVSLYNQVDVPTYNWTLGIADDNTLKAFPASTPPATIINEGFKNAISAFIPMIQDGKAVGSSILRQRQVFLQYHPRQWIAQDKDKNIYFFNSEGRRNREAGLTIQDCIDLTFEQVPDAIFAFCLDGGGSSSSVYYHSTITPTWDGHGQDYNTLEREVGDFLYIAKEKKNPDAPTISDVLIPVGDAIRAVDKRLARLEQSSAYIPLNRIELENYLINGYTKFNTTGASRPWAYILKNNSMYLMGTIVGNAENANLPFIQLPVGVKPVFTTHHLVPGDKPGELYKIVISSLGTMQIYYWNPAVPNTVNYIRLDGIIIPLLPIYDDNLFTFPVEGVPE